MNPLRFLIDECVSHDIVKNLREIEPDMDLLVVGEPGAPAKGTDDDELLLIGETQGRALISGDMSTMTKHLARHFEAGHHTAGLILLRSGFYIGRYALEIRLIWFATTQMNGSIIQIIFLIE
jgi:hypothetical protein